MEITKISAATFGGSGCEQPVEQGFALVSFSTSCHSLEIGSSKLVKVSQNLTDKKSPKRATVYTCSNFGWDGRIRTCECWDQNPVPYRLATSHYCQDNDDYSTPDRKNPHILI